MSDPRADSLPYADRDEEITDRDSPLRGRQAIESGARQHQLRSSVRVGTLGVSDGPESTGMAAANRMERARLVELDRTHDREPARKPRRVIRGQHRDRDPEDRAE